MSGQVDNSPAKSQTGCQKLREILNAFTQNTTVHGVRYLYDLTCPSICRRLIWLVIFFTSAGFFVNQVVKSVIHYNSGPMTVKVEVNFNDTMRFPGVVLCNQNTFRVTAAERNDYKPMLDEYYEADTTEAKLQVLIKYEMEEEDLRMLMVLTRHRSDDMIVRCQWRNENCGFWNFSTIITDQGVCYSFNMDRNKEPLYMNESGRAAALRLTLNIEQYENMIGPHFAAGVKLLLCDEKDIEIFQGHGQGLAAGTHTFIGTKVKVVKRLAPNCTNKGALDYYPHYSERACYVECFTKFFVKEAECKAPYMASPNARFCNFYEYTMFHADLKDKFHDIRDNLCQCKLPCQSTAYMPTFSYLKASEFDIEKILQNSGNLQKKHAKARDALQTTKADDWEKDKVLLDPFRELLEKTERLILDEIGQMLARNRQESLELLEQTTAIYETVKDIIDFQYFVVNKNFFRFIQSKEELHFKVVTEKYLDFLARYSSGIELMTSLSMPGNETRRAAILDSLTTEINAKALQLESTFRVIVFCRDVYRRGDPQFTEYQYEKMDTEARELIIPHALLRKTVTQTDFLPNPDYAMPYVVSNLNQTLHELRKVYKKFKRLLRDTYHAGSLDEKKLKNIGNHYVQTIANFNGNRSIMMQDIFRSPMDKMADREESITNLWQSVKDGFGQVIQHVGSLESTWKKTVRETWPHMEVLKSKTDEYSQEFEIVARLIGKSELAASFVNLQTQDAVKALMEYNDNLMIGFPHVISTWQWMYQQFAEALLRDKVTKDKFLRRYLQQRHPELASMKKHPNSSLIDTVNRLKQKSMEWANFSEAIKNTIKPFHEAFLAVRQNVQMYIKDNEIGAKFYQDNYLSLAIYFEDLNYELIEQQEAYTLTALLSDIGGSMGLFVGGSVLSVFELLDVFLYNGLVHAKSRRKRNRQP